MPPLINKQWEKFCIEYFGDKNGQEAAIAAGYSPRTARSMASRLLTKVNISDRLRELQEEVANKAIMTVRQREERLSVFGREDIKSDKGVLLRQGNISAIAELTKMRGEYPPSRMEIAGKAGGPVQVEVDVKSKLISILNRLAARTREAEGDKQSESEGS